LLQSLEQGYAASYGIALVYHGLGDKDKALEWLERAFQERIAQASGIDVEPVWDELRSDPRFAALVKRIG